MQGEGRLQDSAVIEKSFDPDREVVRFLCWRARLISCHSSWWFGLSRGSEPKILGKTRCTSHQYPPPQAARRSRARRQLNTMCLVFPARLRALSNSIHCLPSCISATPRVMMLSMVQKLRVRSLSYPLIKKRYDEAVHRVGEMRW